MNLLVIGPRGGLAEELNQTSVGSQWSLEFAESFDGILDYSGTHVFQAALIELSWVSRIDASMQEALARVGIPIVIGLTSSRDSTDIESSSVDFVACCCKPRSFAKRQCDDVIRIASASISEEIVCGSVTYHARRDMFSVLGLEIKFSPMKHKLMELLFLNTGRVVTSGMVFNYLYGWQDPPNHRVIDAYICQIRRQIREAGGSVCVETVWGRGYRVVRSDNGSTPYFSDKPVPKQQVGAFESELCA